MVVVELNEPYAKLSRTEKHCPLLARAPLHRRVIGPRVNLALTVSQLIETLHFLMMITGFDGVLGNSVGLDGLAGLVLAPPIKKAHRGGAMGRERIGPIKDGRSHDRPAEPETQAESLSASRTTL